MKYFYLMIFILYINSCESVFNPYRKVQTLPPIGDPGTPLILTPFIESGNITLAQNLSRVKELKYHDISYSGFLTVDKQYDSNMFFWFFPAINNDTSAPVILWLQGGPGATSLFGLFEEHGPIRITTNGNLKRRKYTWASNHAMLYIDNPVGTGFSFTTKDDGYSKNEVDVGKNLYIALIQFFQLFPQYQKNDFFVTGESYAGKYVPAVSYTIHNNNPTAKLKINLKGLAMGNAFCDPEHMITGYGDYLYQLGLIDTKGRDTFHAEENKGVEFIKEKKWSEAFKTFDSLLDGDLIKYPSTFYNLTGFKFYFNFLHNTEYSNSGSLDNFFQKEEVRKAIHVGNATFNGGTKVEEFLMEDVMQSVKPWVETLLENYRVLIYNGQLDIIVAYPFTVNFLNALNWSGSNEYKTALRNKWHVHYELAGYSKTVKNFTEVLVRNAGHMVPFDQPLWALDLITRFTSNKKFD
uniref:Carboxypeptidase n=1 Tax=Clastoptera arizonana TaxID=38151 RepID=A0A1B6EFH6_9HEMI